MRFRSLAIAILGTFLVTGASSTMPVHAKTSKAAATSEKTATKTQQITGEIVDWSDSAFKLKVGAVKWGFSYDKSTTIEGKAAVGARAQVKYTKDGSTKMARSITITGAAAPAAEKTEKKGKKGKK